MGFNQDRSMIDYKALAKTAAVNFINNSTPLNDSIAKLAEENDLNPAQINRVSELSNKAVHQYCLLKTADKNFTFELADASKIASKLSNNDKGLVSSFEPMAKAASVSKDRLYGLFGNPEKLDISKVANLQERRILIDKFAAAIDEINSRITYTYIQKAAEVQELKTQIEQMKMYGIKPEDIRQTLVAADPSRMDEINKLMKEVSPDIKSGEPAEKAPQEAPIIPNPQHPVVISVKNIFAKNDSLLNMTNTQKYLSMKKHQLETATEK